MQQSYATQSLHLSFWGLRKIVACSHSSSQCLLVSTVFGTVSSLHTTSFLMIFTLVYILLYILLLDTILIEFLLNQSNLTLHCPSYLTTTVAVGGGGHLSQDSQDNIIK